MNAERWRRVEELYHSAKERDAASREQFLQQECGDDIELRHEVESLLEYETGAGTAMVLDRPALQIAARVYAIERRNAMLGRTLGHYRIESWLGAGGMGEVYTATDTRLDRLVAVKVLSEELSGRPEALSRFETEAKAAAALSHPNILAIHDFGEDDGIAYAVTELLRGETLRARLIRGPLGAGEAMQIALAVAHGLAAAHAKGITHSDLKPENIFLTEDGGTKILDFGLAQIDSLRSVDANDSVSDTESGALIGTVAYMSPEQADGKKVDPRSDVFSFGSMLYEMLAGARAFARKNKLETLAAIRGEEPGGMGKFSAPALEPVVARCLRKLPSERYGSGAELASDLRKRFAKPRLRTRWKVALACGVAIALAGGAWTLEQRSATSTRRLTSLAVLPLNNVSHDPEEEYFADGMTDVLISDLAQIGSLRVISRTSVLQFKGTNKSLREIARELNVDGVVEGSVNRSGDQVRITAELVDAATDRHLWARSYTRKTGDVLTLQAEVAREIAGEIRAQLTPGESGRLSRRRPVKPAALDAFLKGRSYWGQFTEESLTKSIENYEQAIRIEPAWGAAYAGLSEAWTGLGWIGARPWQEVRAKAKDAAVQALALDREEADAHAALAVFSMRDWDWKTAEEEDKTAIALNPSYATAHMSYANILRYLGRTEESIAEAKRAVELDPLSVLTNQVLGECYLCSRRPDLAIGHCQAALEVHPDNSSLLQLLGESYVFKGTYDKAAEAIARSNDIDGIPREISPELAYINALTGKQAAARKTLRDLQALARELPVDPGLMALICIGLGERREALALLEEAYNRHSSLMAWLKVDMRFDPIRDEPKFQDLMRRVGLI